MLTKKYLLKQWLVKGHGNHADNDALRKKQAKPVREKSTKAFVPLMKT
ncbi:hypothetical protein PATA110615_31840 [Paenibacillus taichungensis]